MGNEDSKEGNSDCNSDEESGYISVTAGQYIGPEPRPKAYRLERKLYIGSRSSVWLAYGTEYVYVHTYHLISSSPPTPPYQENFSFLKKKGSFYTCTNLTPQNDFRHGDYSVLEMMNNAISEKVFEDEDSELFFHSQFHLLKELIHLLLY